MADAKVEEENKNDNDDDDTNNTDSKPVIKKKKEVEKKEDNNDDDDDGDNGYINDDDDDTNYDELFKNVDMQKDIFKEKFGKTIDELDLKKNMKMMSDKKDNKSSKDNKVDNKDDKEKKVDDKDKKGDDKDKSKDDEAKDDKKNDGSDSDDSQIFDFTEWDKDKKRWREGNLRDSDKLYDDPNSDVIPDETPEPELTGLFIYMKQKLYDKFDKKPEAKEEKGQGNQVKKEMTMLELQAQVSYQFEAIVLEYIDPNGDFEDMVREQFELLEKEPKKYENDPAWPDMMQVFYPREEKQKQQIRKEMVKAYNEYMLKEKQNGIKWRNGKPREKSHFDYGNDDDNDNNNNDDDNKKKADDDGGDEKKKDE